MEDAFIYADTIARADFKSGVVRLQLGRFAPNGADGKDMTIAPTQTLVLPLDGFVNALHTMGRLFDQLDEAGIVKQLAKRKDVRPATATADAADKKRKAK
jgi:hypothetical protein